MEPTNLNDREDDAALAGLLHRASPPLPDDGFSNRVLAVLPVADDSRMVWRRVRFCLGGAVIGSALAMWGVVIGSDYNGPTQFATSVLATAQRLADPRLAVALAIAAGSLLFVFGQELKEKFLE